MRALIAATATSVLLAAAVACGGGDDGEVDQRPSGVEGLVLGGPQCPVEQAGSPCPDKPLEVEIEIYDSNGSELITTVRTRADGRFWVSLEPGDYLLVPLPPDPDSPLPAAGEQQVTVRPEQTTEVAISYDTGIR
jgi:hypothetical protein